MTALARANGWTGFDGIGEKVERGGFGQPPATSGWMYRCDGMPTLAGCSAETVVTRRWTRTGTKKTGWLVTYGLADGAGDDGHGNDTDVVLTYCPACAVVVNNQPGGAA